MRRHQRGGTLLVIPAGSDSWRESILQPMKYSVTPPYDQLRQITHHSETHTRQQDDEIRRSVDAIAGLTAVDGATLINNRYELLVFGAKIVRTDGSPIVERVVLTEAVEQAESQTVHTNQLGGTRHLAAAQFVQDQRDALALVASQDGRFTIFAWSAEEDAVHAHRIETLLL
jgi:DNA integrity scanning protein DisA with diadenylate cyclase activity